MFHLTAPTITEPSVVNMSSLHLARAGLMYLYWAGQRSSPSYTAQETAQLQHIDPPLTWWPLSLLLIDLPPPIDSPACGSLIGKRMRWRLSVCTTQCTERVLFQQGMTVSRFSFSKKSQITAKTVFSGIYEILFCCLSSLWSCFCYFHFFPPTSSSSISVTHCPVEQ